MNQRKLSLLASCIIGFAGLTGIQFTAVAQPESSPESSQSEALSRAERLNSQAIELYQRGNYEEAIPLIEESLSIIEAALGKTHPAVAQSLNNLAALYQAQGNYAAALPLYERALTIRENAPDESHPAVAQSLNDLAVLYKAQGNYAAALPLFERALAILENVLDENHPDVATILNNLAALYQDQGNDTTALLLHERALTIRETALDENHPEVATSLSNLAGLYQAQGNYAAALPLYERALAIQETTLRENHPNVANSLNNLASLYIYQGKDTAALPLYERALAILENALDENHPDIAISLNNLAWLYRDQGNYTAALPLFERALNILENALDENHPNVANSLNNLAALYQDQGNYLEALLLYERTLSIEEKNLNDLLLSASENRGQQYMNKLSGTTNANISFSLNSLSGSPDATQLALTTVLQRKGRVLDATNNTLRQLITNLTPENQALFDELRALRSQIANRQFSGLGNLTVEAYQAELRPLEARAEGIEEQLARSSAEFRTETQPVTIAAVQAALPENSALVEFVRYFPFDPTVGSSDAWGSPRYVAYILTSQGQAKAIDIGDAATIDQQVAAFQNALGNRSANVKTIARALDEQLMAPIRPLLGDKTHLLLSPDSQLNLIPFDALVDENDSYLIETYQISYLTSGRDLLKLQLNTPSQQNPLLIANPDYGSEGAKETEIAQMPDQSNGNSQRSVDAVNLIFAPLPGTAEEADAITPLLADTTVLTQAQATESRLKQVTGPSILHIATHGFFLPDVDFIPSASPDNRSYGASLDVTYTEMPTQVTPSNLENPLLRSGLALAGANLRSSGNDDGIFTALEAASLNLHGTQLVVLSACETGTGTASTGEGVYGLRRAFVMAGAQSQLMSLWQVDDYGTSELMQLFYHNLMEKGQGRSEALRNAQIEMMNTGTYAHPYYWSSFIFSGDWRPLSN